MNRRFSSSVANFSGSTLAGSHPGYASPPAPDGLPTTLPATAHDSPTQETKPEPQLSWFLTVSLLLLVAVVSVMPPCMQAFRDDKLQAVAFVADWLVESMDDIAGAVRKEFVGLILLPAASSIAGVWQSYKSPILGDLRADCVTAINVSVRGQLTFSISVAIGSTIVSVRSPFPFRHYSLLRANRPPRHSVSSHSQVRHLTELSIHLD